MTPAATPEELRSSIEAHRRELVQSVNQLRTKTSGFTDWRSVLARNRRNAMIAAGVLGFVVGGGIAGITGLFKSE